MTVQSALFKRLSTLENLPTLPHILLKLIEACNRDNQDLKQIAEMVGKDPALSTKILKLVNSAYFGLPRKVDVINQAVVLVGTSGIKNLAICACVYDIFPRPKENGAFNLKAFWWHSLRCAFLAKHMAAEWDTCHPDEAFLSGLLHDIGKALLWVNFKKPYETLLEQCGNETDLLLAGETHMGATHAEAGAWLLDRWKLESPIVDCVRYHHEQADRIAHAFPMVKIVHVANLLSKDHQNDVSIGLTTAQDLFRLDIAHCQGLMADAEEDARDVAESLDINVDSSAMQTGLPDETDLKVQDRLTDEVRHLSLTIGTLEGFLTAEDQSSILKCLADGIKILFDVQRLIFFLMDEKRHALVGHIADRSGQYVKHARFSVSNRTNASLLVNALEENRPLDSFEAQVEAPLAIIDEQIIRLLGGEGMYCLPLAAYKDQVGVLAVGINRDDMTHLSDNASLLKILVHKGASALRLERLRRRQLQLVQTTRIDASIDLARHVVHEVNNPLGVIKNYLKVLGIKLAEAGIAHDELRIINDEIMRVSRLLQKLTTFSNNEAPKKESVDINALISDIVALTKDALLSGSKVDLHADLEPDLPAITADADGIKQVFINLIKNAAEAMAGTGGDLEIRTRFLSPPLGEKSAHHEDAVSGHVEIVVSDNGPGIAEAVREKLFDPYVSTKTDGHPGLGLSIIHNTIKSFDGTIICESIPDKGTTFTIELPVT
jgi:putative nucleotidyltransferase with HDIG domain